MSESPALPCSTGATTDAPNSTFTFVAKEATDVRGSVISVRAFILEDVREADILLKSYGHDCDRITHNELLSASGTEYTGKLLKGDYDLLWISSPHDWHTRTPSKKTTTHLQRIHNWLEKALALGMIFVLFGPPGFLWKVPTIKR